MTRGWVVQPRLRALLGTAVALAVVLLGAAALLTRDDDAGHVRRSAPDVGADRPSASVVPATGDRPGFGPKDAAVTVVEFTDYRCQFCARHAADVLPRLRAVYGKRIRYEVRALPVEPSTPDAVDPFAAALCADEADLFWPVHDLLFEARGAIDPLTLRTRLGALEINPDKVLDCVGSPAKHPMIVEDVSIAARLGIVGTPAFVIDGQIVNGAKPFDELSSRIEAALTAAAA